MKRLILPVALVLLLAAVGIYLQRRVAPQAQQVAAWLPAGTILFEDLPDLHRTAQRWLATELAQIIAEPEVQALLTRPLAGLSRHAAAQKRLAQFRRIDPAHIFLAMTEWNGTAMPKAVAGVSYTGSRQELNGVIDELRKGLQKRWPEGKSDLEKYGSGDIETFTTADFSAGAAYRGQWVFIATDTALLKATLDRFDAKPGPDSLAELPAFKNCLKQMPGAPDEFLFLRPQLMADKLGSWMMMLNPVGDPHVMDGLQKVEGLSLALKLDGAEMRDAIYIVTPTTGADTPLAQDALKLSTPDTIVAVSKRLEPISNVKLPAGGEDPTGIFQMVEAYLRMFADQGLDAAQFDKTFGPESGLVLDWPNGMMIPTFLATVDVKNRAEARKFLNALATLPLSPAMNLTHQTAGEIDLYSMPPLGFGLFPVDVTLGLTGKCVIGGLNVQAVKDAAGRWGSGTGGLAETPAFKKAAAEVVKPTVSFSYVDTKAIFERVYGPFRGFASMGFVPHLSDYVDASKLPAPETVSRHLTPMVASAAVKDGGLLMESAGPITSIEATALAIGAFGMAAVPMIEAQIKGQPVTLPSLPGLGAPASQNPHSPLNSFGSPWGAGGAAMPAATPASSPTSSGTGR